MLAPEPYLSACMKVMSEATVYARLRGYSGKLDPSDMADLMDAIHNIPELIQRWEQCNVELLRTSFLKVYEDKWTTRGGPALCKIFDQALVAN